MDIAAVSVVVTVSPDNIFPIYENEGWGCTQDGVYCACMGELGVSAWNFLVMNNGESCNDSCSPTGIYCEGEAGCEELQCDVQIC